MSFYFDELVYDRTYLEHLEGPTRQRLSDLLPDESGPVAMNKDLSFGRRPNERRNRNLKTKK